MVMNDLIWCRSNLSDPVMELVYFNGGSRRGRTRREGRQVLDMEWESTRMEQGETRVTFKEEGVF